MKRFQTNNVKCGGRCSVSLSECLVEPPFTGHSWSMSTEAEALAHYL